MSKENIETLKKRLDKEIELDYPYEQILKTSKEIDDLLVEYYLENTQDIT